MQATKLDVPSYWCPDCSAYYWGTFGERDLLDGDHEGGTAKDDCDWYTVIQGSACGCDEEELDGSYENYELGWRCGNCKTCWGPDMASAMHCCAGQRQVGNDGKVRVLPNLPKDPATQEVMGTRPRRRRTR